MKKFSVIIISLLLVLVACQVAFAKGNVGLMVGYVFEESGGVAIDLTGGYNFTDKFSIAGGVDVQLLFKEAIDVRLDVDLAAKYDIYAVGIFNFGAELFANYVLEVEKGRNTFFVGPGIYIGINISPKIKLNLEGAMGIIEVTFREGRTTLKEFFTGGEFTADILYSVNPNIEVGIEASRNTSTDMSLGAKVKYKF